MENVNTDTIFINRKT